MSDREMRRLHVIAVLAVSISFFAVSACTDESPAAVRVTPTPTPPPVASARDFDPTHFANPTQVTNPWLPLVPGTRFTFKGHATNDGERVDRRVVFTVTDLTKVVDGVRTIVAWERDYNDGELEEVELAFFAQDDDGSVWHFGEYPEELEGNKIVKTPTWIAGLHGARPGIQMQALPRLDTPSYAEGWGGSDVHWNDRGRVYQLGQEICVPADCYRDVLTIDEFNPDEPGTHQLKFYAAGIGGIRVGWRGSREKEREVLLLVSLETLGPSDLNRVREAALAQETRAYRLSPDVYGTTKPIDQS